MAHIARVRRPARSANASRALRIFRCAPGAVTGAVGELDDHACLDQRVDVSAGVAGGDSEFALKRQGVEHGLSDKEIRDAVNGGVPACRDLFVPTFAGLPEVADEVTVADDGEDRRG